jgi:hypothetical protein
MRGKTKAFLLLFSFFLTMCKSYANQPAMYTNGLSCRNYTDYRFFEWRGEDYHFYLREEGADCTYSCPDGTIEEAQVAGTISPLYSSSKEELDAQFCGVASSPTPESPDATASPTLTAVASPTPTSSPTPAASPTAAVTLATEAPLLTGGVSMCDLGGKLINFKIAEPNPDLTGQTLEVQIADQVSSCYVNPTNPSLLTCTIPIGVSFPASIVVRLNGAVVNDFVYSGVGCAIVTTPTPAPRVTISYP